MNNTKTKEGEQNMVQVLLHGDWTNTTGAATFSFK
jgi:hypothetical protein